VRFELEQAGEVRVGVYDVAGRPVRRLHSGRLDAGRHALSWDGTDQNGRPVASGIYYSRLEAGGRVQSLPMTLVK
jgi:flagellar hook assembly protein FlgD